MIAARWAAIPRPAAGLCWQDLDLDAGFLTVRETRTSASNSSAAMKVITDEPKSGKGRRIDLAP